MERQDTLSGTTFVCKTHEKIEPTDST